MNNSLMQRMQNEGYSLVSIDLFSGPGGLCTGFKWAGILPLIAVEWTDTTVETYSQSHNAEVMHLNEYAKEDGNDEEYLYKFMQESTRTLLIHGDINLVSSEMIKHLLQARYGIDSVDETIDIVSGGAPCESFSLAGTRTVGDERDDLFDNIVRIARTVKTKAILFENVKGMFSKPDANGDRGAIFRHICNTFEESNKKPSYKLVSREPNEILLKACDYGVPQLRERLFLVSIRRDLIDTVKFVYPEKEFGEGRKYPYVTVEDALSDLPYVGMGEETTEYKPLKNFKTENQKRFVGIMRGIFQGDGINATAPTHLIEQGKYGEKLISSHKGPGHIKRKQEMLALIKPRESMKKAFDRLTAEGVIDQYRHIFPNVIYGSHNRRLIWEELSFTMTSHCLDEALHPEINRAITPREAARIQSFPDWYQFCGPYVQFHGDKVQDRYEQIGDAIPPLLANALAKQFVSCLPRHI